jgi:hypothetical protein
VWVSWWAFILYWTTTANAYNGSSPVLPTIYSSAYFRILCFQLLIVIWTSDFIYSIWERILLWWSSFWFLIMHMLYYILHIESLLTFLLESNLYHIVGFLVSRSYFLGHMLYLLVSIRVVLLWRPMSQSVTLTERLIVNTLICRNNWMSS